MKRDTNKVIEIEKTWCGRYILIVDDYIYLDATGMMGVFFDSKMVGTSLTVMCKKNKVDVKYPSIYHGLLPDFIPGTYTEYRDIKRLLPSQIYNYVTKKIYIRPLLPDGVLNFNDEDSRTEAFIKYFVTGVKNMKDMFYDRDIWFALTGGHDSRTAVALFYKAGISFKTFTLEYDNIPTGDVVIPAKIAKTIGSNFSYIKRKKKNYSKERMKQYKRHTAGMAVDEDMLHYAYGQYQELQKDKKEVLIIHSNIWECTREAFSKYYGPKEELTKENVSQLFVGNTINKLFDNSTQDWMDFVQDDKVNSGLNIYDRLYWELRAGCWLSSIEMAFDMMEGIISIQPVNSRILLSILYGYDEVMRKENKHQEKIIEKAAPCIANVHYSEEIKNTNKYKWAGFRNKLEMGIWLVKSVGIRNTYNFWQFRQSIKRKAVLKG